MEDVNVEQEAVDLANQLILHWAGRSRAESSVELGEGSRRAEAIGERLREILLEEYPDSAIGVRVDGHRRLIVTRSPA